MGRVTWQLPGQMPRQLSLLRRRLGFSFGEWPRFISVVFGTHQFSSPIVPIIRAKAVAIAFLAILSAAHFSALPRLVLGTVISSRSASVFVERNQFDK